MPNFTYLNTLFLCVWLQVINKVKFIHQGVGHIKVKVKYLHPFKFYVAHTFCKRVVRIRLNAFLLLSQLGHSFFGGGGVPDFFGKVLVVLRYYFFSDFIPRASSVTMSFLIRWQLYFRRTN